MSSFSCCLKLFGWRALAMRRVGPWRLVGVERRTQCECFPGLNTPSHGVAAGARLAVFVRVCQVATPSVGLT